MSMYLRTERIRSLVIGLAVVAIAVATFVPWSAPVGAVVFNQPPDCSNSAASPSSLWPPNHKMKSISVVGVTDPDGDAVSIVIDSIFQDEPVQGKGSGNTAPDGSGVGTDTAQVRAELSGTGDGRVYHIGYRAADGNGGSCSGTVTVEIPQDQSGSGAVDGGPLHDST